MIKMILIVIPIFLFVLLVTVLLIYTERKLWAYMQVRLGPMRVGPKGILQPIADGLKLFIKEDIIPASADRWIFNIAPLLVLTPALMVYCVIPFGKNLIAKDLNIGILYIFTVSSVAVIGIIMAGWSSNNKYSLLGGMRAAAQVISYEVPVILSVLGVVMLAGSLSMNKIVESQATGSILGWYIFRPPFNQIIGFIIYFIGSLAELNRTPFDLPEAESELVSGYNTEYSGMKFAFFFLAEWMNMFLVSAVATTLFLGGWLGPVFPLIGEHLSSFLWFFGKCSVIMFVIIWIRATFPRFRVDQLTEFSWKVLIPVALLNILITGAVIVLT